MKNIRKIFGLFVAFCFCLIPSCVKNSSKKTENARAYTRSGFLDWDTQNKLIYAYQNSLIIAKDGDGTTVYLDIPSNFVEGETLSSGDGILTEKDLSLYDIYLSNQSVYDEAPPQDGANLSEWSIVFGGENVDGSPVSSVKMNVLMTGGDIKNIYSGHSSFDVEANSELNGKINFTITGGSVNDIFADQGYEDERISGHATGSQNATFNLFGGSVQALIRTKVNAQQEHNVKVNLKGNIKLVHGIEYLFRNSGKNVNIVGELGDEAELNLDLNNEFGRSDILFSVDDEFVDSFDLSRVNIKNKPLNSDGWNLYKLGNDVRFGYNEKIQSAKIEGDFVVGKVLRVVCSPNNSTPKSILWKRFDAYLGSSTIIGAGEEYTLKEEDGGKTISVVIVDKNNDSQSITLAPTSIIQRIDLPAVLDQDGQKYVYANGNDLLIAAEGDGSTIYLDNGILGQLDENDVSLKDIGISNAFDNGADLSDVIVSAGCSNDKDSGDIGVTLLSGKVKEIIVASTNGGKLYSNIVINLFGGEVEKVVPNKENVILDSFVNIAGDVSAAIYGVYHENGATHVNVSSNIESKNRVKIVLNKAMIMPDGPVVTASADVSLSLSNFVFVDDDLKEIDCFTKSVSSEGIKLAPINPKFIKIVGTLRDGKTLQVQAFPANAYIVCQWFRSSTQSFEDAVAIEGATKECYTLTKQDIGKYIFVVVNDEKTSELVAVTKKPIKKAISAVAVVFIVITCVIFVILAGLVVWFILWKKNKIKASFLEKLFKKIDSALFKEKKELNKNEKSKTQKPKSKKDKVIKK